MDPILIAQGAMTLLKPLLEKVGESAVKTISEKLDDKTTEKKFWQSVKSLFIIEEEVKALEAIENKPIATAQDINLIKNKITEVAQSNPAKAAELQSAFNLSSTDMLEAELLLKSAQKDMEKLREYYEERRNAGIEAEGQYENMIARTKRRMAKDEKRFIELVKGK
ncbi:MAG: hypothetical protein ACPG19_10790 [Saprospiraceae bacterium]